MVQKVYVYVILFATLMMTIGGSVTTFMALADIINPAPYYQSFDQYVQNSKYGVPNEKVPAQTTDKTEAQLKESYDRLVADEQRNTRNRAINSLIKSLGWIIIPLPIFLYYQRKIKAAN